jgi:hypothetical protein
MHEKMKRLDQIVLIGMFIGFSWLAMQAVHEFGHILGAVTSGGQKLPKSFCIHALSLEQIYTPIRILSSLPGQVPSSACFSPY